MRSWRLSWLLCFLLTGSSFALDPLPDAVFVRVVDVGAGLCSVVKMPGDHYMIYDAGNFVNDGKEAFDAIKDLIPVNSRIELMVLSHSDADHLGAVDSICANYQVRKILHSGLKRTTQTWERADNAIKEENAQGCIDINLRYFEYPPGATYRFGEAFVTMVCGFHEPPEEWDISEWSDRSEFRNAGSIVIRLLYKGKTILFCGDTVGRHIDDPDTVCIAAEKFMVDNSVAIPIDSDVIIAPHHGADNGSSTPFIEAVTPDFVVFSAGHQYEHPRKAAAQRYLNAGILPANMFRTDRGDDEGDKEWDHGRVSGQTDRRGDDDVDILIHADGQIEVEYRNP